VANFIEHIDELLALEGGGTVHTVPGDAGGTTKWGIAQNSHPNVKVKELTRAEAMGIYRKEYWKPMRLDDLDVPDDRVGFGLAANVFRMAVHAGVKVSANLLQQALNYVMKEGQVPLKVDGDIGSVTISAFNGVIHSGDADVLLRQLIGLHVSFYDGLFRKGAFHAKRIRGYLRRIQL
jgi:lysozyme family protein